MMGSKLGIFVLVISSIICSSFITDIESKSIASKSRPSRALIKFNPLKEGRKVVSVINDITTLVLGVQGIIDLVKNDKTDEYFQGNVTAKLDDIFEKIDNLDNGVKTLGESIGASNDQLVEELTTKVDQSYLQNKFEILDGIDALYEENFSRIQEKVKKYGNDIVDGNIARDIKDNRNFKSDLQRIVDAATLSKNRYSSKNIFAIEIANAKNKKNNHQSCGGISTYDRIFSFYEKIVKTVTKGYTMIILAYQFEKINSKEKEEFLRDEQEKYQKMNKDAIIDITKAVKYYLDSLRTINFNSTHACDPETWEEGVNYLRMKNYAVMKATETCIVADQCDCIPSGKRDYYAEYVISKECPFPFQNGNGLYDERDVEYSEYKNYSERILVRSCRKVEQKSELFNNCINDKSSDPYLSVRKLSLEPATCYNTKFAVMIGARFYEKDGIIGIEAQCAHFLRGQLDPRTVYWNERVKQDSTRANPPRHIVIDKNLKSFNLDDIVLPDGEFVTSIRFIEYPKGYISLEVTGRKLYNPVDNSLYDDKKPWIQNTYRPDEYNQGYRKEINLRTLPLAIGQEKQTYEMSKPGQHFVKISNSNLRSAHITSPLVPYFDMNEYSPPRPIPLGGIGFIYKSVPGHAGLLAFKFITSKYSSYISRFYADEINIASTQIRH